MNKLDYQTIATDIEAFAQRLEDIANCFSCNKDSLHFELGKLYSDMMNYAEEELRTERK